MRALAVALMLAAAPASAADRCASPKKFVGVWAGKVTCRSGVYPAVFTVTQPAEEVCVSAFWNGSGGKTGSSGRLRVDPSEKVEVFLMTADPMTSVLRMFDGGRRMTFSPDPAASGVAKLIKFSGSATVDAKFLRAFVRYTYSTPITPADPCSGTMLRRPG